MNSKKFLQSTLWLIFILSLSWLVPPAASANQWQPLIAKARNLLGEGNAPVGTVFSQQDNTVIINLHSPTCQPGMTLAVKGNTMPGVPLALQNTIATITIKQRSGNQARGTITTNALRLAPGTPVFLPNFDALYLYTNLSRPNTCAPYLELVKELQLSRTHYTELQASGTSRKPLIIRFETQYNQLTATLVDHKNIIYFKQIFTLPYAPQVTRPFNTGLNLKTNADSNKSFNSITKTNTVKLFNRISIKKHYKRFVFADLNGNGSKELAMVNKQWLEVFIIKNNKLAPIYRLHLPKSDCIIGLHNGDFNHNGRDELYITSGIFVTDMERQDTQLSSSIIELEQKKLKLLDKSLPYYLRTMETREAKKVLLAQEKEEFKQYKTPIKWAGLYKNKLAVKKEYREARGVYSIYNFTLNPSSKKQVIVLDMKGNVGGYDAPTEELLTVVDDSFGIYEETSYPQKLAEAIYEGSFNIKKNHVSRYPSSRFTLNNALNQQSFLIKKERQVNPDIIEKGIAMVKGQNKDTDQVVGLRWKEGTSIEKSWESPSIPRDIIDFGFTNINGASTLVLMTRNDDGKCFLEMVK